MNYYQTPLRPNSLFSNNSAKCSLGESISQHIMLIISTPLGKNPSLPDFGCAVWDLQFQLVPSTYKWENKVSESLQEVISKYEKRIKNIIVKVRLTEVEVDYAFRKYPDIKKKARVAINAEMEETGEHFGFSTEIYVSPISK